MSGMPRILPLIGVAIGGVLAINALDGARALPDLFSGATASAEEAKGKAAKPAAPTGEAVPTAGKAAPPLPAGAAAAPARPPAPVCAPTAAELARQAGLSPAELQVLQSLGARRGQLDQRESDINLQLALLAAAEAKLDQKVRAMNKLKAEMQGLMQQADTQEQAETNRLVKVFESMKPKDAAPRMELLDDSVRLPIAAAMKERALSAILAQMKPAEAKRLTEALARRYSAARAAAAAAATELKPDQARPAATAAAPAPAKPAAAPAAAPKPG